MKNQKDEHDQNAFNNQPSFVSYFGLLACHQWPHLSFNYLFTNSRLLIVSDFPDPNDINHDAKTEKFRQNQNFDVKTGNFAVILKNSRRAPIATIF